MPSERAGRLRAARIPVALAVAVRQGRLLVARREGNVYLAGSWEFPGGKIEPGEEPADAARRELLEETGLEGGSIEPLVVVSHDYPDRAVALHAFLVRDPVGEVRADGGREWAWMSTRELADCEMPEANGPILRALAWRGAP